MRFMVFTIMALVFAKPIFAQSANSLASPPNPQQIVQQDGTPQSSQSYGINFGDTTWMLISTALVMLMTPGLALFYGGMVRRKNVLGTIMQSFIALGIITVQWILVGYSLALAPTSGM